MVKLKNLKAGESYYIIDENGCCEDIIIKFEVIKNLSTLKKNKNVEVKFLKYLNDNKETDVVYYEGDVIENLYLDDEDRIFNINELEKAEEYLDEIIEERKMEDFLFEIENHTLPEEYPDWDGDESIMYYIENYIGE